jgi:hypothetical protein
MRTPPIYIEVILHCYYSPEPIPREEAPAVQDAIARFLRAGMIEQVDPGRYGSKYQTTARGKAWVEMICATPYPEQVRRNPVTSEADANLENARLVLAELTKELQLSRDGFIQACAGDMPAMAQRIRELEERLREADADLGSQGSVINELRAELIHARTGDLPAMAQRIRELEASLGSVQGTAALRHNKLRALEAALDSVQGTAALRHNKLRELGYEGPPIMSDKPYSEMMREANQPAATTTTTAPQ